MEEHIKNIEEALDLFKALDLFVNEKSTVIKGEQSWEIIKRELTINEIIKNN
tara:strand:+ start:61238 stop:61393 length:156 start_codon:yes stop_codon:yes gene_type:complete